MYLDCVVSQGRGCSQAMDIEFGALGGKLDEILITILNGQFKLVPIKGDHLFEFDGPKGDIRDSC